MFGSARENGNARKINWLARRQNEVRGTSFRFRFDVKRAAVARPIGRAIRSSPSSLLAFPVIARSRVCLFTNQLPESNAAITRLARLND